MLGYLMMIVKWTTFVLLCLVAFALITYFYIGNALNNIFSIGVVVVNYLPLKFTTNVSVYTIIANISTASKSSTPYEMLSFNGTATNDWVEQMEEKYWKSNERIRKVCQKYREKYPSEFHVDNKYMERNIMKNMMVDVKHQLAYCRHGKVT